MVLNLWPYQKEPDWAKIRRLYISHHKLCNLAIFLGMAITLVALHHRDLAAITTASVLDKIFDFLGDVIADRVFPDDFLRGGKN